MRHYDDGRRCNATWRSKIFVFYFFLLDLAFGFDNLKSLQGFLCLLPCFCTKEKERERERERESTHLFQNTSLPNLVSLFPTPPFPVLLVGIGVTTEAPSNISNTNNTNNSNTNSNNNSKRNSRT
jgi:hypothetical protein